MRANHLALDADRFVINSNVAKYTKGLVVQEDAKMDMQETLEDANAAWWACIVHQWQVPIKTCYLLLD